MLLPSFLSRRGVAALILGLSALSTLPAQAQHAGHHHHGDMAAPQPNLPASAVLRERTVVPVRPAEYEHVLGDMHKLLRSIGEISTALAQRDWAAVGRTADALRPEHTMGSADPAAVSFHARLPQGWSSFGAPMHMGFARIADEARGAQRSDEVLRLIGETTRQCAGCHARFQLRLEP